MALLYCDSMVRDRWTETDDLRLFESYAHVSEQGHVSWSQVSSYLRTEFRIERTPRQCRERWRNRHPADRHPWTDREDKLLLLAFRRLGPKWAQIQRQFRAFFPERLPLDLKNRYKHSIRQRITLGNDFIRLEIGRRERRLPAEEQHVEKTPLELPPPVPRRRQEDATRLMVPDFSMAASRS
jgi:hypothetical protein